MNTPLSDKRNYKDIIEEMKSLVPNYTPEWNFDEDNPDFGSSLFMVFAMQLKETIDLLNRSLDKNLISFLNMSNIVPKPPKASETPVVFTLTSDDVSVFIQKGTRLSCNSGEDINFETESDIEVIPVKINSCYFANDIRDRIIQVQSSNINLFDYSEENNIQLHEMYLLSDKLFNIESSTDIVIRFIYDKITDRHFKMISTIAMTEFVSWEFYAGESGWIKFDDVNCEKNEIVLKKRNNIKFEVFDEFNARAIRIKLSEAQILKYENLFVELLDIQTRNPSDCFGEMPMKTDKLYYNDKHINSDYVLPFGNSYNITDCFYIGNDEIFTKENAIISIAMDISFIDNYNKKAESNNIKWKLVMKKSNFDVQVPAIISIRDVEWQYYNGLSWETLKVNEEAKEAFYCDLDNNELSELVSDIYEKSVKRKRRQVTLSFKCPKNFRLIEIGGQNGYFIRGEIKNIENNYEYGAISMIPIVDDISLSYSYGKTFITPDAMVTRNNNEKKYYSYELNEQGHFTEPFYGTKSTKDTMYLCLDKAVKNVPLNILFIIGKIEEELDNISIKAEYSTRKNNAEFWREISINDETNNLTKTGIITLLGIDNIISKKLFGTEGFWLRFTFDAPKSIQRVIENIYFNAVRVAQQTDVNEEFLDLDIETSKYKLFYTPVLKARVLVNEIKTLNKSEIDKIINENTVEYYCVKDEMGIPKEFWIKWDETDTFINKKPDDRVYIIDTETGEIIFGNNINAKTPPAYARSIKVSYKYGGGSAGNVSPSAINSLYEGVAFIDKVFNPITASGGVDSEKTEEALLRAAKKIKHKSKAISAADIENIILGNFIDVKDVKCLPNKDKNFHNKNGDINIIILPKNDAKYGVAQILKERIKAFLKNKLPFAVTEDRFHITGVKPIKINVKVSISCGRNDNPYYIKMTVKKRLEKFFDLKSGNFEHKGWKIGEIPKKHAVYAVISETDSSKNTEIKNLTISYRDETNVNALEMSAETVDRIFNGIIVNGEHDISVTLDR